MKVTTMMAETPSASDRILKSDRKFFARRPHRRYRLPRAFHEESEALPEALGPGLRWFCVVTQLAPYIRARGFYQVSPNLDADTMSDADIERLMALAAPLASQ